MNEADARRVLLLRAFEQPVMSAPWSVEDGEAVGRQALQRLGEQAGAAPFIAERARLGIERLAPREPAVDAALAATGGQRGPARAVVALAVLAGALADAVGSAQRINILAPPLLALLVWNLVVYAALAFEWQRARAKPAATGDDRPRPGLRGALASALRRTVQRAAVAASPPHSPAAAPVARFVADWWQQSAPLNAARLAGVLHAAAAAFALAAIVSLYVRGLGFEYRAGWDSTFLTPAAVQGLLSLLFAPALAISGMALPDAEALSRLRFSSGPGENAAGWIHLQALTIALFVLLPRGALAVLAGRRARRLANNAALPLDDAYFARLASQPTGRSLTVQVLPYSYQLPAGALPALTDALERLHPGAVDLRLAPAVPLGGEDDPAVWSAALGDAEAIALLFASTATPERENHGAFVAAVAAHAAAPGSFRKTPGGPASPHLSRGADGVPGRPRGAVEVLVDESAFRARFSGADGAVRLEQRRAAWRRMLAEQGAAPHFVDLTPPGAATLPRPVDAGPTAPTRPLSGA